jgi:hypothetical protein
VIALLVLPLLGNLVPSAVSFLVAMRYYAGNWAWNAWLFHGDSAKKLDKLKRASKLLREQQQRFMPPVQALRTDASFLAFRAMHLQGRMLGLLLHKATDGRPFQEFTYVDGENIAGSVLGWNFGEGHLADERLMAAIQEQCDFDDGELRAIMVERSRSSARPCTGGSSMRGADSSRGAHRALRARQAQSLGLRRGLSDWTMRSSSARAPTGSPPPSSSRAPARRCACSKRAARSAAASAPPR